MGAIMTADNADRDVALCAGKANAISFAFAETNIAHCRELVNAFDKDVEILLLDQTREGIWQIPNWLNGRDGIEAVCIFSHATPSSAQC